MKTKLSVLILSALCVLSAWADPVAQVTQRYSVDSSSNYQQLSTAFQQAVTDFKNNSDDAIAFIATKVIYEEWVDESDKLQLINDHIIQQSEAGIFLAGIEGIIDELESNVVPNATLKQSFANGIWTYLTNLDTKIEINQRVASRSVVALLLLQDDRGLEAILTETEYIKNLQATDGWDKNSPQTKFADLVTQYTALVGQEAGAREQVAIYELARLRKVGGATEIVTNNSVINLSQF